jgi:hypothetical protein
LSAAVALNCCMEASRFIEAQGFRFNCSAHTRALLDELIMVELLLLINNKQKPASLRGAGRDTVSPYTANNVSSFLRRA